MVFSILLFIFFKIFSIFYINFIILLLFNRAASLILCGDENEAFLEESFERGANLGVYLHLKHFNKGEDLNLEQFWSNFLNNYKQSKVDLNLFVLGMGYV